MGFDVKITTFSGFLDLVAPFSCRGCGHLGEPLCECCKNYNISRAPRVCARCKRRFDDILAPGLEDLARCSCKVPVFGFSYREGAVKKLVEDYKFKAGRRISRVLTELLDSVLPADLGPGSGGSSAGPGGGSLVYVVPLPTISKHIRERGFDHTKLLAKQLCKRRKGLELLPALSRKEQKVQVGADEKTRKAQAKRAYELAMPELNKEATYLLLDDVWTTGASMEAAISVLRQAGARKIYGAVIEMSR